VVCIEEEIAVAKKKNVARNVIHLECTEQRESGVPGISRYTTMKNKKNTPKRLELMKYNPYLRRMTLHREVK
jgi:large subunit ribosomal protein L33